MNSGKAFISLILITFYLFFPGNGLALANQFLHDRGLPVVECPCSTETDENSSDKPHSEDGAESDLSDHGCNCSCHLPAWPLAPEHPHEIAFRLPYERPQSYPEVYIPIFVPPQNIVWNYNAKRFSSSITDWYHSFCPKSSGLAEIWLRSGFLLQYLPIERQRSAGLNFPFFHRECLLPAKFDKWITTK